MATFPPLVQSQENLWSAVGQYMRYIRVNGTPFSHQVSNTIYFTTHVDDNEQSTSYGQLMSTTLKQLELT